MATNVFICWSGELSGTLAEVVRQWLPQTLQFVRPHLSSADTKKSGQWASKVSAALKDSQIGILCLTRDNLNDPWVLFEAGALSENLDSSRVCAILCDLEPGDVRQPLGLFQQIRFTKEDFKKVVGMINAADDNPLQESALNEVFEMWWPQLEMQVTQVLAEAPDTTRGHPRTDREILEEILKVTRVLARCEPDISQGECGDSTSHHLGRLTARQLERMGRLWDEFLCQLAPNQTPPTATSPDEIRRELEKEIEKEQENESSDNRDGPSDTRDTRRYQKRY
jgi:hypothetical protein